MILIALTALAAAWLAGCRGSGDAGGGAPPPSTTLGDLSGEYTITSASNPGGASGYQGTVRIAKEGDVYQLVWSVGNTAYRGVGIPIDHTLAVGWGMGSKFGVAVYRVSGGKLQGRWATSGSGPRSGVEELEGPEGLKGTYRIVTGKPPEGSGSYTGTVSITPSGETYTVTWTLPAVAYNGVGIRRGDLFIVGWGEEGKGAGVVSYEGNGSELSGKWAAPGGTQLGTEVLTRR